jgi:hypothetical protein
MSRDAPTSGVCANESISWSPDDPYAQVMGSERPGHVRGVGFGCTSGRARFNLNGASTSNNHEGCASQINRLETTVDQMRNMIDLLMREKDVPWAARVGNAANIPGTTFHQS